MTPSGRVALIEDHVSFRQALAYLIGQEPELEVVWQAGTLAEAREIIDLAADVALVDLGLPDGEGTPLIRKLREVNPRITILVLTASVDRERIARAVEAGAAGVLHKSSSLEEILDALRRLLAGETLMPPNEVAELVRLAGRRRDQEYEARLAIRRLTPREREVLQVLAEGLSNREIARRLHITVETERTHMVHILEKLGVHSRLEALVFAVRHGLVEIPRSPADPP
ncbi:response regulator transcription factor [Rubrobacter taiwanensis]|jgi:DNA-binding NarL/FixJ family response regulator|uniref:Response regulator transcription factor n=1 Tax=Rubrobacter taiwanensis TaxID=185139 RepID=A0A4R1BTZ0_9ACTN|nr:response regulator transcription factor [Rubrobacter taiwanensis]TCJ20755.1 response regulator transcription factor [Rubrobacter taiwanensis]